MSTIHEAARDVPVAFEADLCVVGGSCTGVFAAVTAARMGLTVALIEAEGSFGGVATSGLVNIWHSLYDTQRRRRIIGGLTAETVERLRKRAAVREIEPNADVHFYLNTDELKIELDELVTEAGVRPFLHARFAAPVMDGESVVAAVLEDKTGRRAVRARYFVDATGDGDLLVRAGGAFELRDDPQPPTVCAKIRGIDAIEAADPSFQLGRAAFDPAEPNPLPGGWLWASRVVGAEDIRMVAGTRVAGANCADGDELTRAEIEGRRQVRALCDILRRRRGGEGVVLLDLASTIGIRESRHARCLHRLTEAEVLEGRRFDDAVANGSYRVDVHHSGRPGLTFRYLDGREEHVAPGQPTEIGRWRPQRPDSPTFYQVPYRSLVPGGLRNVLVAGRLIDTDRGAYGAIRVMVNCNQTGEAAGAAAALAARDGTAFAEVDASRLRAALAERGAVVI